MNLVGQRLWKLRNRSLEQKELAVTRRLFWTNIAIEELEGREVGTDAHKEGFEKKLENLQQRKVRLKQQLEEIKGEMILLFLKGWKKDFQRLLNEPGI